LSQFSLYSMPRSRAAYVVDIQSRLLDELSTRVVIPLLPRHAAPSVPAKTLNPLVLIDGAEYVLMTQNLATVPLSRLRAPVGTLAAHRDEIVRAIDALLSGL
jgi:toxin CcdB